MPINIKTLDDFHKGITVQVKLANKRKSVPGRLNTTGVEQDTERALVARYQESLDQITKWYEYLAQSGQL
jgi:hypothetical protein